MAEAELDRLLTRATMRRIEIGEAVFEQGQKATRFFLLLHGRLKVAQVTPAGQQIIVRVVHPGDLFGFAQALQREDYPGTPIAAAESVVMSWPNEVWGSIVEQNPHLAVNAMRTIGQRLQEAHTRIREMSTEEVERRVAHAVLRLVEQAGRHDRDGVHVDFPLSRQDVAELTGTTLHTVSRLFSAWESQGIVKGGRQKLLVRDKSRLQALADGSTRSNSD
ncbi:Crp/Fnr family transcriptional regulator [Devosia sp. XJ19-1]|uniref:Crp/Fnr family transcriptional regulator n=1 Tax=Devosia ureilytica TaxID=2952754 RepID=A0A9Q4AR09_9HYPH|nr:Crp/Fnr family transcriptional regulator [Devosia ureilytica]MCP8884469.1 Crp/Fnr family transcriptional regulator [Devosia ureilytica]MCP8888077.1 Crp/Fnr family transcriptional regulator [Devosia ureilytica]